jgi:hypothetical protein
MGWAFWWRPLSTNPRQGASFSLFPSLPSSPPAQSPASLSRCLRIWGGGKSALGRTRSPVIYLLWRASGRLQESTCLQSLGGGEARACTVWLWLTWGVPRRPGKMPLWTNSPTSSRAALVGPRCFAFLVLGFIHVALLLSTEVVPCKLAQGWGKLCDAEWRSSRRLSLRPISGEGGEPRRARPGCGERGCCYQGQQYSSFSFGSSGYGWGIFFFFIKAPGIDFVLRC